MSTRDELITLNSAITQLMRRIRRLDETHGIGRARLSALAVLHFGGPCSLSDLAYSEMVSRVTMHHVVNALEADGLTSKRPDPADGRRQIISLTPSGTALITAAHTARIEYLGELLDGIGSRQLTTAAQTLSRIRDNAAVNSGTRRA